VPTTPIHARPIKCPFRTKRVFAGVRNAVIRSVGVIPTSEFPSISACASDTLLLRICKFSFVVRLHAVLHCPEFDCLLLLRFLLACFMALFSLHSSLMGCLFLPLLLAELVLVTPFYDSGQNLVLELREDGLAFVGTHGGAVKHTLHHGTL